MVDGVTDIGAPIFDSSSESAVASLTVPFVVTRRTRIAVQDAPAYIASAADRISTSLGYILQAR
jgi:DNA-binding IclR family transcriptional regulator